MKHIKTILLSEFLGMSNLFDTCSQGHIEIKDGKQKLNEGLAVHASNRGLNLSFNRDCEVELMEDEKGQYIELHDLWNKLKLYPIFIRYAKSDDAVTSVDWDAINAVLDAPNTFEVK